MREREKKNVIFVSIVCFLFITLPSSCIFSFQGAVSIKKFYKSMYAHKKVDEVCLEYVLETINDNLDIWIDESDISGDCDWF